MALHFNVKLALAATELKKKRLVSGISLGKLAAELGITKSMLSRYENCLNPIRIAIIQPWADALNIDADPIYCAAGIVPPDVADKLTTDMQLLSEVRELIK